MKKILCLTLGLTLTLALCACGAKQEEQPAASAPAASAPAASAPAASAPADLAAKKLSDEEAAKEIEAAMQAWIKEAYGDKVTDARVVVEKIYTVEEEQKDELLKDYKLGEDEYAFEVNYELLPAKDAEINELTAATGQLDEKTGWVIDKYNVGILRPAEGGGYTVTNMGTAF